MRPLNHAVPGALAELLRAAPNSPSKVTFAWRAAVGSAIERETSVRLEKHVLLVDAADRHWACEVNRSASVILARLQAFLGPDVIKKIEVRARTSAGAF